MWPPMSYISHRDSSLISLVLEPKRLQFTGLLFQIKNQRWILTGTVIGPLNARWTLGSDFDHDAWHSFHLLLLLSRCILEIWGRMPLAGSWRRLLTSLEESGMSGLPSALQVSWVGQNNHLKVFSGFAFVLMDDPRDAEDATRELDGSRMCGRRVKVRLGQLL